MVHPLRQTPPAQAQLAEREAFLRALGERVRELRSARGLTRRTLAVEAQVSERHLANLELGSGNASILVLRQVAQALQAPVAALLGDLSTSSPEWLLLRQLLAGQDDAALQKVRLAAQGALGIGAHDTARVERIALIGLRGAGKSSLGRQLAQDMGFDFIELGLEIEKLAGCSASEIQALYGPAAYRRYERRALEEASARQRVVISTPGGLVADAGSFAHLLAHCTSVWLRASPEDHMRRVLAQGDTRPIAASGEAMEDLKSILASRAAFYSKADLELDTSAQTQSASSRRLLAMVQAERLKIRKHAI